MNKKLSSRLLCSTAWIALGMATLFGCGDGGDGVDDGVGGSGGAGSTGTSAGTSSSNGTNSSSSASTTAGVGPATSSGSGDQGTTSATSGAATTGAGGGDASTSASTSASTGTGGTEPEGKFVGNITTSGAVRDGFAKYWNQITPENEGKWGSVESSRGNKDWSSLDRTYKYAQDNKIIFKHHVFVWGSQQPSWLGSLSPDEQKKAVRSWMEEFCKRYPDTKYIDVVNEPPPHTTPSYTAGLGGNGASGWDWIVNSFKWAREFCPNAVLILNDYNNIEYENEHRHFKDIAKKVIEAGAPVDALGAQAHDAFKINTNTVKGYIDSLAELGKPVYITEYDIGEANDNRQKQIMEEQFTMFWNHPKIPGITLWGYIVGKTWRNGTGLQQENGTMRPAMQWLMDFLDRGG
ncbi:endo-1,4-beta-xylanase [Sorangium sp. So ce327]|uniref:endo-1,4-beta-xylanase n=1 Tax=Sorangium sp. So ce327 TaxID=3133301 RepID=UPI003F62AAB2